MTEDTSPYFKGCGERGLRCNITEPDVMGYEPGYVYVQTINLS